MSAQAQVTLQVSDGILIGASGVLVNNQSYDLSLRLGTCADLFGGCDNAQDFAFHTIDDAAAASQALLDQVLVDRAPQGNFNSMLDRVPGCVSPTAICRIMTPYGRNAFAPTTVDTYTAVQLYQFGFFDTTAQQAFVPPDQVNLYAVWSQTGSPPVPEPGTLLLAATAAALFAGNKLGRKLAVSTPRGAV
jgi:hypothetical protein